MPRPRKEKEGLPVPAKKSVLKVRCLNLPDFPTLPDRTWNELFQLLLSPPLTGTAIIQAVIHKGQLQPSIHILGVKFETSGESNPGVGLLSPEYQFVAPQHRDAMEKFMGQWEAIAWYIALNRDVGLLPSDYKVPRNARIAAGLEAPAIEGQTFLLLEKLCGECFPDSGGGYRSHVDWFGAILLDVQRSGWEDVLKGGGSRQYLNEWRSIHKALKPDDCNRFGNPYPQDTQPNLFNLIEICRYKYEYQSGFRDLWERFLKASRPTEKIAKHGAVLISKEGKAQIRVGHGRTLLSLKNIS